MPSDQKSAVVFVHGILGFSSINILGKEFHYFRGFKASLADDPPPVYFPALPPSGTIKVRAEALGAFLHQIPEQEIHLIAHSMGGLDSRYAIHHLDPQQRIKTLITIATPHRGTPLAEWFINEPKIIPAIGRRLASPGLYELTPTACDRFNRETPDRPDVTYLSYAAVRPITEVPLLFRPWAKMLQRDVGDNDSQVAEASAKWGDYQGNIHSDHLEAVGWSFGVSSRKTRRPFNHLAFYHGLLNNLCY